LESKNPDYPRPTILPGFEKTFGNLLCAENRSCTAIGLLHATFSRRIAMRIERSGNLLPREYNDFFEALLVVKLHEIGNPNQVA